VPPEDSATQLFIRPIPTGAPEPVLDYAEDQADAGSAQPWDEPTLPGRDGTLLAVVPIPGTRTSLAIVGYAITTSAASPAPEPTEPPPPEPTGPRLSRPRSSGLRLDHGRRRVWIDGREIELTYQEFELLAFLSAHPATVFTRADLIEKVWHRTLTRDGQAIARDSRTVDVHVSRVRNKLGQRYGQCLVTEYRVGYQFRPLRPLRDN
jgi:DNA-binding winged helix-turn-helix (wHTH) protein